MERHKFKDPQIKCRMRSEVSSACVPRCSLTDVVGMNISPHGLNLKKENDRIFSCDFKLMLLLFGS